MKEFFKSAEYQEHPLRIVFDFMKKEESLRSAKKYDDLRFVGYVLDIGFDVITMITSDPYKVAVGGVPRNSFLIMIPDEIEKFPPHFSLLRVLESAPTPLSKQVQETYFELHKKSMPELDRFTASELQWGALKTSVVGMFYPSPDKANAVEFSGDLNNFVSAHKYAVYSPNDEILDLIINSLVPTENRFQLGELRMTESRLPLPGKRLSQANVFISTKDFMGARTAMFGKTRLGKSNVVKLIAASMLETAPNVGQLIFDINGEYANDNPQDESRSLASSYKDKCFVYALTPKSNTKSEPLKINFFELPNSSHKVLANLLENEGRASGYVKTFCSVEVPSIEDVKEMEKGDVGSFNRGLRKILIYWAILKKAGFAVDEKRLQKVIPNINKKGLIDPGYNAELRKAAYEYAEEEIPSHISTLDNLTRELGIINRFRRDHLNHKSLKSKSSGDNIFDPDDIALIEFLEPPAGRSGPTWIQPFRIYHDQNAGDYINKIIERLETGNTVILDLGNADPKIIQYFSDDLTTHVFHHQVKKFSENKLGNNYIQVYFEEAHNLFPNGDDARAIYSRLAKEGAKYQIGMVYSTQSVTTISKDLLAQTENFFIAHMSSQDEVNALAKVNIAYNDLKQDILISKTPGYMRMLSRSHRFVIPVQARKFSPLRG